MCRSGTVELVELGPFDMETGFFQVVDQLVDRPAVPGFALDLDHRILGRLAAEHPPTGA